MSSVWSRLLTFKSLWPSSSLVFSPELLNEYNWERKKTGCSLWDPLDGSSSALQWNGMNSQTGRLGPQTYSFSMTAVFQLGRGDPLHWHGYSGCLLYHGFLLTSGQLLCRGLGGNAKEWKPFHSCLQLVQLRTNPGIVQGCTMPGFSLSSAMLQLLSCSFLSELKIPLDMFRDAAPDSLGTFQFKHRKCHGQGC